MLPRLLQLLLPVSALLLSSKLSAAQSQGYYGKYIGRLKTLHHKVSGEVFAVDLRTLHIRDFNYDGEGPAAYFYAGNSKNPSRNGFRIPDEQGLQNPLKSYQRKHVTITLPEGKTLSNIKWFSVWCDEFAVNFGDVKIPKNLDYPRPQKIDPLNGVHLVSSEPIVVVDAQTLLIPSFSYDGEAPDAKFWVGRGNKPSPQGIRVPDENGKEVPLRRYDRKTIVLTLPGDTTIFDIGHFGVWCEAFAVDFGHVRIARGLNIPPSLKMLGVSPQSKLNCEVLWDDLAFEVRWAVAGDSVVLQLVSKLDEGEYMSFGLSGDDSRSKMVGGDVAVAWVDKETLKGFADDYFLDAKSQCSGTRGSCPDERFRENTNNVRLLNAAMVNGYSIVTYQRPMKAQDEFDLDILSNGTQPVIWAIGPLNSRNEVSYHSLTNKGDVFLEFGRAPKWNCPIPESDSSTAASSAPAQQPPALGEVSTTTAPPRRRPQATPAPAPKNNAWEIPPIQCYEPEDGVFYAQMGPTGGKHGYPAITGHVGWGISWYINGLLIPEINVVRGKTYTFVVEGGLDPETPARYHPFYITDDPVGGYEHKTPEERAEVHIFAGARQNRRGDVYPTGTGRLCNWTPDPKQPPADEFASFGAYQRTLTLECDEGEPGVVQWTPDKNTPDTVYYQCFTHRYLGWKINVLDSCDTASAGSEPIAVKVPAVEEEDLEDTEDDADDLAEGELQGKPSIQVTTKVKPNGMYFNSKDEYSKQTEHKYIPLTEFPEQNSFQQQQLPFSYEPVTTKMIAPEDEGTIRDAFIPPPALQEQPMLGTQFESNNTSSSGKIESSSSNTQDTLYFPQQTVVKDGNTVVTPSALQTDTKYVVNLQSQQFVPSSISYQTYQLGTSGVSILPAPAALQSTQPLNSNAITQSDMNVQQLTNATQQIVYVSTSQPTVNFSPSDQSLISETKIESAATPSSIVNFTEESVQPVEIKMKIPVIPVKTIGVIPTKMNLHTTLIPQVYGRVPLHPHPQMVFQRPLQPHTHAPLFRHPVPHRHPPQGLFHHPYVTSASTQHNYIIKKPFYRPPPQRPLMMAPQYHRPMVKPRIPLQHASTSVKSYHFTLAPHQPLKLRKVSSSTSTTSTTTTTTSQPPSTQATKVTSVDIKPSPPILPSEIIILNPQDMLNIPVAVNTGFNPHSVVVEGGFKPIITSKITGPAAEDRSSIVDEKGEEEIPIKKEKVDKLSKTDNDEAADKTEETMIAELASDIVAAISEEERKENPFQGQEPETFEPIFIPSPPDRRNGSNAKKPLPDEGLAPPVSPLHHRNSPHPSRKNGHPYVMIRPRPGLVRRPLYPNNIVPPFRIRGSPTFRYQQSDEALEDEMAMAADRMDSYYLPPGDTSVPPGVVVTYDGKSVTDTGLAATVDIKNTRIPMGTADFIRGTPQFVPYRGEIPPPVPDVISPENIPQLRKQNQQLAHSLPEHFKHQNDAFPDPPPIRSTQLTLVQNGEELNPEGSEIKEVIASSKINKTKKATKKTINSKEEEAEEEEMMSTVDDRWPFSTKGENVNEEESTNPTSEKKETTSKSNEERRRERRSAHHEPGHKEHANHQHTGPEAKSAAEAYHTISSTCLLLAVMATVYL